MEQEGKAISESFRTLERLFRLMNALADSDSVSLAHLSTVTGLHKSTTHRFLATLLQYGWVGPSPQADGYGLGPTFLSLCERALARFDLRSFAHEYLQELRDTTGESANLGVLQDGKVVCVDSVSSREPLRISFEAGSKSPMHATGLGKAIAAWLPDQQLESLLERSPMQRYTPTTVVDPERFKSQLGHIRQVGYALDDMELTDQVRCIAAPVFSARGRVVGAISVSGPAFRVTLDRLELLSQLITRAAGTISTRLGYLATSDKEEGQD